MKRRYLRGEFALVLRLGLINILRVIIYRLQVVSGWFVFRLPIRSLLFEKSPFFTVTKKPEQKTSVSSKRADLLFGDEYAYFFRENHEISSPPDWFFDSFSGTSWQDTAQMHWSRVGYFNKTGSDIKVIWELSRFYWATDLALAYCSRGDAKYLERLNQWMTHWCDKNHVNQGVNWLCAQEASVRVVNVLLCYHVLGDRLTTNLERFFVVHGCRIAPTLHYARAQCNNHATSEAVALYVLGLVLGRQTQSKEIQRLANQWRRLGRGNLEKLCEALILQDGSFSQYSVTYHRMMLDALSLALYFQRIYDDVPFSSVWTQQYQRAFQWLYALVDPVSGDAPNLGSNDGTAFFKLDTCDYRDFRPTLQLASVLLNEQRLYDDGPWDAPLKALHLAYKDLPISVAQRAPCEFQQGGYAVMVGAQHWVLLNYPRFKFRPSQCDAMHVDLWVGGVNVLRDSGTYSYRSAVSDQNKFSGVSAHNSIQFDEHEQMPRLSRFLWGAWLKTKVITPLAQQGDRQLWCGEYTDHYGCTHRRQLVQENCGYVITDWISGYKEKAILRWHLAEGAWEIAGNCVASKWVEISLQCNGDLVVPRLKHSWYSLYYRQKQQAPVLEVEVNRPDAVLVTQIRVLNP